jgi:phage baseplate assembly protein W
VAAPRSRAFRFADPGLVSIGRAGGLAVGPTGGVDMVEGDMAVRQAILLLLTTRPGERVMRPSYGSLLHRLVFAPNDATTAGLAIHYVRRALAQWEPRVDVVEVDAGADLDHPEQLVIELRYRVKASQQTTTLTFPVELAPVAPVAPAPPAPAAGSASTQEPGDEP